MSADPLPYRPIDGDLCLDCPAWAWEEQPDGAYGKARHESGTMPAIGWPADHSWRPGWIVDHYEPDDADRTG